MYTILSYYDLLLQINDWLKELAITYDNVDLVSVGKSYEGRDILGVKVTFNGDKNEKRTVFIESNIHAREWLVNLYFMQVT